MESIVYGMPLFAAYLISSLGLLAGFAAVYSKITAFNELELIKQGNMAAALSYSGALIGFALPISASVMHSGSLTMHLFWAATASTAQIVVYLLARKLIANLDSGIESNNKAYGVLLAAVSLAVGLINAGSIT